MVWRLPGKQFEPLRAYSSILSLSANSKGIVMSKEQKIYDEAVKDMNDQGRYKLANYMAHGYDIASDISMTILKRQDKIIAIDKDGQLYVLQPAI